MQLPRYLAPLQNQNLQKARLQLIDRHLERTCLLNCRVVQYQLGREYPRTSEEVKQTLVRIVAAERRAFDHGYGRSETKDGLFHTTILDHKRHGQPEEEAMDISEMKEEIRNMEEELLAVSDGKKLDKSKFRRHKCKRYGHFMAEIKSHPAPASHNTYERKTDTRIICD